MIYDQMRDQGDTLCFVIDLFGPSGREPQDMEEVNLTIKEIQFSNRSKNRIRALSERHNYAHYLRHILERHKEAIADHPHREQIRKLINLGRFDMVHILYQKPAWEVATCDCEFSKTSIESRRRQGYSDMKKALAERAERAEERRLARQIAPVGSVYETFAKGICVKSSFDTAAALARRRPTKGRRGESSVRPQFRSRAIKVPPPRTP